MEGCVEFGLNCDLYLYFILIEKDICDAPIFRHYKASFLMLLTKFERV